MQVDFIFQIAVLIMSVVVHEVSHGYAAYALGDQTAKYEGRLTLNPIKHLDPIGSIVVPALLAISSANIIFGWAKPVPYNPHNLRPGRWSEAAVAAAGPASNIALALFFGILFRVMHAGGYANDAFLSITVLVVLINLVLAIFNLVPIPPLDGSKLLYTLLPERFYQVRHTFEQFGLIFVILFIFVAWRLILPIVLTAFIIIAGVDAVNYLPFF